MKSIYFQKDIKRISFRNDIKIQLVLVVILAEAIAISIHLLCIIIELKCILTDKTTWSSVKLLRLCFHSCSISLWVYVNVSICDMTYVQVFRQTQYDDNNIFNQEKFPEPDARNKQLDATVKFFQNVGYCWRYFFLNIKHGPVLI